MFPTTACERLRGLVWEGMSGGHRPGGTGASMDESKTKRQQYIFWAYRGARTKQGIAPRPMCVLRKKFNGLRSPTPSINW